MPALYDNRMGFFGSLLPGLYQCETVVNGQTFTSAIYTVEADGKRSSSTEETWLHDVINMFSLSKLLEMLKNQVWLCKISFQKALRG